MAIELDEGCKVVRNVETGATTKTLTVPQWSALMVMYEAQDRIVSLDEIANAVYSDEELLHDGVSDQAIYGVVRRLRVRIGEVSDLRHIVGFKGWGQRLFLQGAPED